MIDQLIMQDEGRTLEFKENTQFLSSIIKSIIAFANTAGGIILIGIEDRTKKIIGIENALDEEERLSNAIADSIMPFLLPTINILYCYRQRNHNDTCSLPSGAIFFKKTRN